MEQTLFDKIWDRHVVTAAAGFPDTLYIDKHFINKTTSVRAFEGLRRRKLKVYKPKQTYAMADPEYRAALPETAEGQFQTDLFHKNCADFDIEVPEKGQYCQDDCVWGLPGQVVLADQDNIDNIGALGIVAIAITGAQVEQVLATQCLLMVKPRRMKIEINGVLAQGITAKDMAYHLIANVLPTVAEGYFVEYTGDAIMNLDIAGRIQICNCSREIGAIGGIIAADEITFGYLRSSGIELSEAAISALLPDEDAVYDQAITFRAEDIMPGNYTIDLSVLLRAAEGKRTTALVYEEAGIIQGHNDTDYILRLKEDINRFEKNHAGNGRA